MEVKNIEKFGIDYQLVELYLQRYRCNERNIVVTGEFSSGKSTFINAFLNKSNLLPSENVECTPILIDIVKGDDEKLAVQYKDGSSKAYRLTDEMIKKYGIYHEDYDTNIMSLSLTLPDVELGDKVHLIDTPGTNTILKEHEELTNYMLKQADIVIYVMNKVVSQSDVEKIKNILNYTKRIIFVLTHMDDLKEGIYVNRQEAQMQPLLESAKRELTEATGFEVDVLPVGSKAAFSDASLINEIRAVVEEYLDFYQANQLKTSITQQLVLLFASEFEKLKVEIEQLTLMKNGEINNLDQQLEQVLKKQDYIQSNNEMRIQNFEITSTTVLKRLESRINQLFSQEEEKMLAKIERLDEVQPELLQQWFHQSSLVIGNELRNILETGFDELLSNTYSENINLVQDLYDHLGFQFNVNIDKPAVDQLNLSTPTYLIDHVNNKLDTLDAELDQTTIEIKQLSETMSQKRANLSAQSNEYKEALAQRRKVGAYIPQFDEHIEEGGAAAGAMVGRFIGEVADVLLLLYNPVGGAAKVADTVKDSAKMMSYITTGMQKTAETAKKASVVVQQVRQSPMIQMTKALDLLSLGFYGEKLGQYIGESIKSTQTLIVENKEHRQRWQAEMAEAEYNLQTVDLAKKELENDIENDRLMFAEIRKRKKELEEQRVLFENKKKEIEMELALEEQQSVKDYVETYYKSQINHIFELEKQETMHKVCNIYHAGLKDIMEKSEQSLVSQLDKLKSVIEATELEKTELMNYIEEKQQLLNELENYPQWIHEWMS
ncbi:Predicted GTPase [Turicibacter sanguinis]|nr:Predicted GTPase [Turicibacter sanguinis]